MLKYLQIVIVGVIVSLGFFPFEFYFFPGLNTKNIMAGIGLIVFGLQMGRRRTGMIDVDFLVLLVSAGIVSLVGFASNVYNNTSDYTYATYIMSMLIWLSSSNVIVSVMRFVHGKASVELIINYLLYVCLAQCLLALLANYIPIVGHWVDNIQVFTMPNDVVKGRLHGLGCALDVAGTRLAAVLILLAYFCSRKINELTKLQLSVYLMIFLVITVVGNMIARTTVLGLVLALVYWIFTGISFYPERNNPQIRIWKTLGVLLIFAIPALVYLYNTNSIFHANIRFAFEGFFSLVEKGTWEVSSNERLKTMMIFPDNLKTWIIGDGYFDNPLVSDYHYIGPGANTEYYMFTDIGYLRFIFYFGVIGTAAFMFYMYRVSSICSARFPGYKVMFMFLLLANYIIWCKVATDIFFVFALFLMVSKDEYEPDNRAHLQIQ